MKYFILLLINILLIIGCYRTNDYKKDRTWYYTAEINNSSYNIFLQYYLDDGNLYRIKLLRNSKSNSNEPYSRYPDNYPHWHYYENPNQIIKKILLVDLDSYKLLKRIEGEEVNGLYKFDKPDSVYGMTVQYYIFEITDKLIMN